MKSLKKILWVFLIVFLMSDAYTLNKDDTKISTTRNIHQSNICAYSNLAFTLEQREQSKDKTEPFDFLSNDELVQRLKSGDFNTPTSGTVLITLPHVIALTVLLCLIPALFCCCTWPEKYPVCKKFRKPVNYIYSRTELKCPAYFSVLFFLIIIIGSLMALVEAPEIVNHLNNVGCKNATLSDEILNGRMSTTDETKFFVGLKNFKTQLLTFVASKINTFFSEGSNSLSTANLVRTKQTSIQNSLQNAYTNYNNLDYNNAFTSNAGVSYNTIPSSFKQMHYGPTSDPTKILGNIKSKLTVIFDEVNLGLDNMIAAWNVLSTKTQSVVTSEINTFNTAVTSLAGKLQAYIEKVSESYYDPSKYESLQTALKAFYAMIFSAALIGFISSLWLSLCKVSNMRFFMYFGCGVMNVLAIYGFCYLSYLAFYHPQVAQTCFYVDSKLSSGQGTKQLFQTMGLSELGGIILPCMSDGNGKIISEINPSYSTSFDNINIITQGTLNFNSKIPSYTTAKIDAPFTQAIAKINKISNAEEWQINDTSAKLHIQKVVDKTYTLDVSCDSLNVHGDAWMPSFTLFTCPAGKAKMGPCANLADKIVCPLGCYEIMNTITSPSGDASYATTLATRYGSNTCNYYNFINRLHTFWNIPRKNRMDTTKNTINNIKTVVNDYTAKVDSVKANLNSFQTKLESNFDSMTNLKYGSFNGMDCRVISESIWQFRDSVCIGLRNSMKYNIICLCLICYSTLLMSCFVTCAGVRHFEANRKTIIRDRSINEYQNSSLIQAQNKIQLVQD